MPRPLIQEEGFQPPVELEPFLYCSNCRLTGRHLYLGVTTLPEFKARRWLEPQEVKDSFLDKYIFRCRRCGASRPYGIASPVPPEEEKLMPIPMKNYMIAMSLFIVAGNEDEAEFLARMKIKPEYRNDVIINETKEITPDEKNE